MEGDADFQAALEMLKVEASLHEAISMLFIALRKAKRLAKMKEKRAANPDYQLAFVRAIWEAQDILDSTFKQSPNDLHRVQRLLNGLFALSEQPLPRASISEPE